ncbi:MAG TPA: MarR family winged helix-turn-helix transcriptional regulator [Acidimicrobiales bacterium]|nr:MarR family winged helix-turn-helix transcriptional regulator [Acidimicrobiales bacterium]
MPVPERPPIGVTLGRTAKTVSRAFDRTLSAAGGSLPTWLILVSLKTAALGNQRELAEAAGIRAATLTHHLNTLETDGLICRRRDPANRRVHQVDLTEAGEALFVRLAGAAVAFDRQLRQGLGDDEVGRLEELLHRLDRNVTDGPDPDHGS